MYFSWWIDRMTIRLINLKEVLYICAFQSYLALIEHVCVRQLHSKTNWTVFNLTHSNGLGVCYFKTHVWGFPEPCIRGENEKKIQ